MNIINKITSFFSGTNTYMLPQSIYLEAIAGKIGKINIATVNTFFNCIGILSDNLSRLPIELVDTEPSRKVLKKDNRQWLLNFQPNNYTNRHDFISTLELHRNTSGNAFARINRNKNTGYEDEFELLHPGWFIGYNKVESQLFWHLDHKLNPDNDRNDVEVISDKDILHFTWRRTNGIWGDNPINAINRIAQIAGKGETTIDNFYDNNAFSPMVMETKIEGNLEPSHLAGISKSEDNFKDDHLDFGKKGKMIRLPWNKKLVPIPINMVDARIIETLKHTTDQIGNTYRIPNFMLSDAKTQKGIEEQTLYFLNFTIAPIVAIYEAEFESKLLSKGERLNDRKIQMNGKVLLAMDIKTLTAATKMQVTAGLASINEGIKTLGNKPIDSEFGDMHYVQQQNQAIENHDEWKVKTETKTNSDGNKE